MGIPFTPSSIVSHVLWMHCLYYVTNTAAERVPPKLPWEVYFVSTMNFITITAVLYLHSMHFGHTQTEKGSILIAKFIGAIVWSEVWSFVSHWCLHRPWAYRWIHRIHHRFRQPCGWTTLYAHPVENLVFNIGILLGGIHFLQMSHALAHLYVMVAGAAGVMGHSGTLDFPILDHTFIYLSRHEYHHTFMDCEYGSSTFMDYLFRTRVEDKHPTLFPQSHRVWHHIAPPPINECLNENDEKQNLESTNEKLCAVESLAELHPTMKKI